MRNLYYVRTLSGMPVRFHYSWGILAVLSIVILPGVVFAEYLPESGWFLDLLLTLLTLAFYVGAVAVHVLAQIGVARVFGVRFPVLNLYPLGAITRHADRNGSPKATFWIAASGPAVSFVLWWLLDQVVSSYAVSLWLNTVLYVTAQLSFYLGVFSLLPGLPLDGGRMLRAVLWGMSGDFEAATHFARVTGQVITYGLVFWGAISFMGDGSWVRAGAFVLVGWAIREAGATSHRRTLVTGVLQRLTAANVLHAPKQTAAPEHTLRAFATTLRNDMGVHPTPVIANERFVGMIDNLQLQAVLQGHWETRTIAETMTPAANLDVLAPDTPLSEVLPLLMHDDPAHQTALPVVQEGRLVGLITARDLSDVLDLEEEFALLPHKASRTQPGKAIGAA